MYCLCHVLDFADYGEGQLKILYDGDHYCARFVFQAANTDDFIEHFIATETTVQVKYSTNSYKT